MEVKYLKDEKNEAEIKINNLTIAEVLRAYLIKDDNVEFVAWSRAHPSESPVLKIKTKGKTVKSAIQQAVSKIEKEADSLLAGFKKAK